MAVIERLRMTAGNATYRQIGTRTSTHPESIRRYFTYGHPSVEFVAAFCRAYGVSADWLLNGIGKPGHLSFAETASQSNSRSS